MWRRQHDYQFRRRGGNEQEVRHASRVRESGRAIGPERLNRENQPTKLTGANPGIAHRQYSRCDKSIGGSSMSRPPSQAARAESSRGKTTFAPPARNEAQRAGGCSSNHKRHQALCYLQESGEGLRFGELTELIDLRIAMGLAAVARNSFGEVI